jgi:hypothetical protein
MLDAGERMRASAIPAAFATGAGRDSLVESHSWKLAVNAQWGSRRVQRL